VIIDISRPLDESFAVFPGDVSFTRSRTMRMDRGDSCNVSALAASAHAGTHVDLPLHYSSDETLPDLGVFVGPATVIAVDDWEELSSHQVKPGRRVLFKTRNSSNSSSNFDNDFFCIDSSVVECLVEMQAVLIGVDGPSVDPVTSTTLDNHHALHRAGITILENLDLLQVEPGDYELIALPLKIPGADATWVRAVLRR